MSEIHKAAKAGNIRLIGQLLSQGAELECHGDDGETPLMTACMSERAGNEVAQLLLDSGADLNARAKGTYREGMTLLALAIPEASLCKINLLIESGADLSAVMPSGYTLLTLAACADRMDVFGLLLSKGAPINGESSHNESALSVLSRNGRFAEIGKLLELGADAKPLEWTTMHRAVALGSMTEIAACLEKGENIEALDFWERTPFLLSLQTGDVKRSELLLDGGANRGAKGRCGKTPMQCPVVLDDAVMIEWLVSEGFDINAEDDFGHTALVDAAECGAVACFHALIAAGAEWEKVVQHRNPLIANVEHPEIAKTLIALGADPSKLQADILRKLMGLETMDELPVGKEDFLRDVTRRFGNANPERMGSPFWEAMVHCGWNGYVAGKQFGYCAFDEGKPVWCHDRFGMSLTILPDGRFVQIAGEHEDSYDPDFCIYNDVFVHDGKGGIEIFGYPKGVFPPTDFHSATLVGEWIYILGNLGYPEARQELGYRMPVFRLRVGTWEMERMVVSGESPGWIYEHKAEIQGNGIRISGGKVLAVDADGKSSITDNASEWHLDLTTFVWKFLD